MVSEKIIREKIINKKMIRKYSKFLKNKKVVLVGPSSYLKGIKQHDLIESYDIVVRMNVGYKFAEKLQRDMGERTDILYSSLSNYFFSNYLFTNHFAKSFLFN